MFPAEAAFPDVQGAIPREASRDLAAEIDTSTRPVLIHAVGGAGKTVLMQEIAGRLRARRHVVLFDGYGGGRWRDPADGRHLPSKALMQIVNQMAAAGLCDPMLPSSAPSVDIVGIFRRRLEQAVEVLKVQGAPGGLALMLDAADHAAERARDTGAESFAGLLLQSLSISPIAGVVMAASCRTERRELTRGHADCKVVPAPDFTPDECAALVLARRPEAHASDLVAAFERTGGNPRLLSLLIARQPPPYERPSARPGTPVDTLDGLIESQIREARGEAVKRGAAQADLDALLAGLAFLPPPVPLEELAAAQGLDAASVEGFVADLFPLIEHTHGGLVFRDEPTETHIREWARLSLPAQSAVVDRLQARQTSSAYAARALPGVLRELGRKAELYALASDDRTPGADPSPVARRAIRLARLEAALALAAQDGDHARLLQLALDLSRLTAGHGRSDDYLRRHPDLVALAGEPEILRRLFEDRRGWTGGRASAAAMARMVMDDVPEARRQTGRAMEWDDWLNQQPRDGSTPGPRVTLLDLAGPAWIAGVLGRLRVAFFWLEGRSETVVFRAVATATRLADRHARRHQRTAPPHRLA